MTRMPLAALAWAFSVCAPVVDAQDSCETHIEIRTVAVDGPGPGPETFEVRIDSPAGAAVQARREGLRWVLEAPEPQDLYQRLDVSVSSSAGSVEFKGAAALAMIWPCRTPQTHLVAVTPALSGSVREVQPLWEASDFQSPRSVDDAAERFAIAAGHALARSEARRGAARFHRYDAITPFLAARMFRIFQDKSEVLVFEPSPLGELFASLRQLPPQAPDVVKSQAPDLVNPRRTLEVLYTRAWQRSQEIGMESPLDAFHLLQRFRRSVLSEVNPQELLGQIRLTMAVIISSTNSYAGRIKHESIRLDAPVRRRMEEQVALSLEFATSQPDEALRARVIRDAHALSARFGFGRD